MIEGFEIRPMEGEEVRRRIEEFSNILVDCVEGGAGVSFMLPFGQANAVAFWLSVAGDCDAGKRIVIAALMDSVAVGTVQIVPVQIPNQPHRAEVAKLLVHRRARRRGIARALMTQVEVEARALKRSLLTFDTTTGDAAEQLYLSLGYVRAGIIPDYAHKPEGGLVATSVFYKLISSEGAGG
jgi:ribosomal protein S18 acetylase RimI-like enzyme